MAKKILYYIHSIALRRVFESYKERDDLDQLVLGPNPVRINGILEDYSGFNIKNIKVYKNNKESQLIVNSFKPDIFVQADFPDPVVLPKGCKRVVAAHGIIGNHVKGVYKGNKVVKKIWSNYDLYCGATKNFKDFVHYLAGSEKEVILNALGQLDLLHDPNYYEPHKENILFGNKKPSILFCGFCCKNRSDFNLHNEDYFKVLFELEKIAEKNDWFVVVKPRQGIGKVVEFFKQSNALAKKYYKNYQLAAKSKYLNFIDFRANPCKYFSSDIIVCNGCSTLEIEACLINKPLIIVRTKSGSNYDPFGTVSSGAAISVTNINDIEKVITDTLSGKISRVDEQNALLKKLGISTDGLAHKRIQDRLRKL